VTQICKALLLILLSAALCACSFPADKCEDEDTEAPAVTTAAPEVTEPAASDLISMEKFSAGAILDYFTEIAFDSEFGESSNRLSRWEDEILYSVSGSPTEKDLELVGILVDKLNTIEGFPGIKEAENEDDVNFEILFITRAEIMETFENASESCKGMSEFHWNMDSSRIIRARAAIDCEADEERESTICEEILQSLGLAMDSFLHKDSVFYQGKCVYTRPSELDWMMIRILYHPSLRTGIKKYEAIMAISGILEW